MAWEVALFLLFVLIFIVGIGLGLLLAVALRGTRWGRRLADSLPFPNMPTPQPESAPQAQPHNRATADCREERTTIRELVANLRELEAETRMLEVAKERAEQTVQRVQGNLLRMQDELEALTLERAEMNGRLAQAEAQNAHLLAQATRVQRLEQMVVYATRELRAAKAAQQRQSRETPPAPAASPTANMADFTTRRGLGAIPGLSANLIQRLNQSDIHTIADLAQQTPERLSEIAGLPPEEKHQSAIWIRAAQRLMG